MKILKNMKMTKEDIEHFKNINICHSYKKEIIERKVKGNF